MQASISRNSTKSRLSFPTPNRTILLIFFCSLGLVLSSCGSTDGGGGNGGNGNGGGGNGGGGGGIGTEPTFANVQQIFNGSCSGSGCHIGQRTNGVQLDSYENVIESRGDQYGGLVVVPGDAANSPLVDKIEPNPEHGVRMPETGNYLSDARITQIRAWIDNGAENN